MYDNGYIVKCRSILTNDICLSEASQDQRKNLRDFHFMHII